MKLNSKKITFTDTTGFVSFEPKPAMSYLPEWYKETPAYIGGVKKIGDNLSTPHTIKKCIPVFDAMTSGYILVTICDIQVEQRDGFPYYSWSNFDALGFHPVEQAPLHPNQNGVPYPKFINPWAIKTEPGYSAMFLPPMHNPNKMFTILPGIVDTDVYTSPVNFPFVLNEPTWEGLIPAGTPMVQVIPFKRDSFNMQIGSFAELKEAQKTTAKLKTFFFNSYKRQFWNKKEYK